MTHDLTFINEKIKEDSLVIEHTMAEMAKVIVGQKELLERMMIALLAPGHILLEGVPGLAKTLAIKTLARVTDLDFQAHPVHPRPAARRSYRAPWSSIPKTADFYTRKGPIFTNLLLADEINRAPAKVQSALLEAMQEQQVTIGDESHAIARPFIVMATQNPIEQEGTYPLPEAQIDRFLLKVKITYPLKNEEKEIVNRMAGGGDIPLQTVLNKTALAKLQQSVPNGLYRRTHQGLHHQPGFRHPLPQGSRDRQAEKPDPVRRLAPSLDLPDRNGQGPGLYPPPRLCHPRRRQVRRPRRPAPPHHPDL